MSSVAKALVAADTDRTQEYVFETSRLPEIRGASYLLEELNRWISTRAEDVGQVVVGGGGNLLAFTSPEQAPVLCQEIQEEYLRSTLGATITAEWRPFTEEMLRDGYPPDPKAPFGSLRKWAGTWLRRAKEGRQEVPWIESPPYGERCSSCHLRPANPAVSLPDRPLCTLCHHKAAEDRTFSWFKEFEKIAGYQPPPNTLLPHDLSEIGQCCASRPGYISLIYLDGDGFGRAFDELDTWENTRFLSETVRESTLQAVMKSLLDYQVVQSIRPSSGRQGTRDEVRSYQKNAQGRIQIYSFEILIIGGDDILLIVPADRAIPLACEISHRFSEYMHQALDRSSLPASIKNLPFSLSGGVVLADDHNPVRALHNLAMELKDSAKRGRKQWMQANKGVSAEGWIDFVVLLGTDMLDRKLLQSRAQYPYLIEQPGFPPLSLLARPYPISALQDAWSELQAMRSTGFPNSQMGLLAETLMKGVQESSLFYKYQRARSRRSGQAFEHLDAAIRILQGIKKESGQDDLWQILSSPDKDRPARLSARTVLWDLSELYSLVAD